MRGNSRAGEQHGPLAGVSPRSGRDRERGHPELSVSSYAFVPPRPPVLGTLAQKGGSMCPRVRTAHRHLSRQAVRLKLPPAQGSLRLLLDAERAPVDPGTDNCWPPQKKAKEKRQENSHEWGERSQRWEAENASSFSQNRGAASSSVFGQPQSGSLPCSLSTQLIRRTSLKQRLDTLEVAAKHGGTLT